MISETPIKPIESKVMHMNISHHRNGAVAPPYPSLWSITALGSAVIVFAVWAIFFAPNMWRAAERLKAEQINREDEVLCEKFQMPPGSERFAACVTDLGEVRRRHGDRLAAEAAGMF
jgi:hypothetical protein